MKSYLVEYVDCRTGAQMTLILDAEDKTAARDSFFASHPDDILERITWVPKTN